ncbi:MAG: PilZ domain-containing protein [Desulfobulbales bacterium]
MPSVSHQGERRKHDRFEVRNLAIAVPNKPSSQVARIVNISKGGLAVRYLEQTNWLGKAEAIDILVNSNLLMTNIPIKDVFDFKVENRVSFSIISERQCCLQFGSLSPEQELLLDELIKKLSAGSS